MASLATEPMEALVHLEAMDTPQPRAAPPLPPISRADLLAPLATISAALAVDAHLAARLLNKSSRDRAVEELSQLFLSVNAALERATGLIPRGDAAQH